MTEDFARMCAMPRYVVSTTLTEPGWQPTTLLRSIEDVARLNQHHSPDQRQSLTNPRQAPAASALPDRTPLPC